MQSGIASTCTRIASWLTRLCRSQAFSRLADHAVTTVHDDAVDVLDAMRVAQHPAAILED